MFQPQRLDHDPIGTIGQESGIVGGGVKERPSATTAFPIPSAATLRGGTGKLVKSIARLTAGRATRAQNKIVLIPSFVFSSHERLLRERRLMGRLVRDIQQI